MSVYHITTNGTRVSGASVPNNWSLANCWPFTAWVTMMNLVADGDEVIIDDVEYVCSTALSLNNAANTGVVRAFAVKSRSGGTVLQLADATTQMLLHNDANDTNSVTFENLVFDGRSIPWTTTSGSPILFSQSCPALTFRGCKWRNFIATTGARTVGFLLRYAASSAPGACNLIDCVVEDCSVALTGQFEGFFKIEDTDLSWNIDGLTFRDVSASTSSGACLGLIYHNNDSAITWSDIVLERVHMSGPSGSNVGGFLYSINTPGLVTIDGLTVNNMTIDGLASSAGVLRLIGDAVIRNVTARELRRTGTASGGGNSVGGIVQAIGTSADVLLEDVDIRDAGGFFGTAFYNSGGGVITARRVFAKNITDDGQVGTGGDPVNGLAFYSGGHGNSIWDSCVATGCQGDADNGLVWYIHHTDTSGTANKRAVVNNCTFAGNLLAPSQLAGKIIGASAANTTTVDFYNTIFANGEEEFDATQSGSGDLTVTGARCLSQFGAAAFVEVSGTVDMSDGLIEEDPLFVDADNENFHLASDSPCIQSGWGLRTRLDAAGSYFHNPPSRGAFEYRSGIRPPAANRMVATS